MPTPCANCVGFHYGPCNHSPRQCHNCWGWNHIERYCPGNYRNGIRPERGQPLAGTKKWCDRYGLNDDTPEDHDLKFQILQALKTNPGSAIHLNGICIYSGSSKSFSKPDRNQQPRGRALRERRTRRDLRSLSPGRDRRCPASRSLSPRQRRDRYRSRSLRIVYHRQDMPLAATRSHLRLEIVCKKAVDLTPASVAPVRRRNWPKSNLLCPHCNIPFLQNQVRLCFLAY
jgi:hypothetical protein